MVLSPYAARCPHVACSIEYGVTLRLVPPFARVCEGLPSNLSVGWVLTWILAGFQSGVWRGWALKLTLAGLGSQVDYEALKLTLARVADGSDEACQHNAAHGSTHSYLLTSSGWAPKWIIAGLILK